MALPKSLPSLTSCRFFAALIVLIFHKGNFWHDRFLPLIEQVGWLGVPFFFILSGFVLMWSFDPSQSKRDFYLHRLARIYPLHIVTLCVSLLAFYYCGWPLSGVVGDKMSVAWNVLLVQDWFIPGKQEVRQAWNAVSWTLSCEVMFYLLAPFLFPHVTAASRKRWCMALSVAWLMLIVCSYLSGLYGMDIVTDLIRLHPLTNLPGFLMGAVLAKHIQTTPERKQLNAGLAAWFFPILIYCMAYPDADRNKATLTLLAIPGLLLLIGTLARRDIKGITSRMKHPYLLYLGESSFALYMTHAQLLGALSLCFSHYQKYSVLWLIVVTALCIQLAFLVHAWIEIPARRFLLKVSKGLQP